MPDAELRERIHDRVRNRGETRCDPAFAAAAHPKWVRRRRNLADLRVESWQKVGARHRVIQERAGQELTGSGIVDARLPQRLTDPLRNADMALALKPLLSGGRRLGIC